MLMGLIPSRKKTRGYGEKGNNFGKIILEKGGVGGIQSVSKIGSSFLNRKTIFVGAGGNPLWAGLLQATLAIVGFPIIVSTKGKKKNPTSVQMLPVGPNTAPLRTHWPPPAAPSPLPAPTTGDPISGQGNRVLKLSLRQRALRKGDAAELWGPWSQKQQPAKPNGAAALQAA